MKNPMVRTTVIICVVAFVSSMTGYVLGAMENKKSVPEKIYAKEEISTQETENISYPREILPEKRSDVYRIKENDGKVSIIIEDGENATVYRTYDINVSALPKADRELLSEGIETTSLSDALQLIEDYL